MEQNKKKKSGAWWKILLVVSIIVLVVVLIAVLLTTGPEPDELSYNDVVTKVFSGQIQEMDYEGNNNVRILYTGSNINPKKFPGDCDAIWYTNGRSEYMQLREDVDIIKGYLNDESVPVFSDRKANLKESSPDLYGKYATHIDGLKEKSPFLTQDINYSAGNLNTSSTSWISLVLPIVSFVLLGVLIFFMFRQASGANGKAMNFGKTNARLVTGVKVRFSDVAGAEEEKEELQEIVEFLKNPKKFSDLGARIPHGVLLVGPPGTGKTLFAKAVAGEANVPFFSISGSDFVEMFVGTGAARVRDLFDQAKKNMPCIIFIDEIDAVGRQRGAGLGGGNDEREQTLNQLLVQMDGFDKNQEIIVMAATNRADVLDPALMRPGRFDRQIYVNVPDVKGREAIFKVHSKNKPLAPDVSFKILARMTSGFSGADIENLLNEASILAARANRRVIVMEDILEGINKVIAGPQKKSHVVTESDKRITAYHESGHAIVARVLPNCDEVQEVSIIPRGQAAGYTLTRPVNDDSHITRGKLNDMMAMMLAGRAAEEIVIHDISTGASNDIERASGIARKMVTEWGMSERLGNIFLGGSQEVFLGRDYGQHNSYSEEIAGVVDEEVKKLIDENYKRALTILRENRDILDNMVRVLYEKDTIYTDEVDMLFDHKSAEEIIAAIDEKAKKKESLRKVEEKPSAKIQETVASTNVIITPPAPKVDEAKTVDSDTVFTPPAPKAEEKEDDGNTLADNDEE